MQLTDAILQDEGEDTEEAGGGEGEGEEVDGVVMIFLFHV